VPKLRNIDTSAILDINRVAYANVAMDGKVDNLRNFRHSGLLF
jgi:hypothetical protein